MAVISTPFTKQLKKIRSQFPELTFALAEGYWWSPNENTIFFRLPARHEDIWDLLHEVAHACLGHTTYTLDIELLEHESKAWSYATTVLGPRFSLGINSDYIQDQLDTYRQWMFGRSTCPNCGQTGLQTKNTYSCLNCKCSWRANEARLCALRRTKLPNQDQIS